MNIELDEQQQADLLLYLDHKEMYSGWSQEKKASYWRGGDTLDKIRHRLYLQMLKRLRNV